jgi:hypothetical protein
MSRLSHYQYVVMPFGLMNVPTTFMTLTNAIFCQHLGKFILEIMDDSLIYSKTMDNHKEHLRHVFNN